MFTAFHRRLLAVLVPFLALAAFPTLTTAGHSWGTYHWARTSNPFTLKLGDNVSAAWDAYLAEASADWNLSSVPPPLTPSSVLNTIIVTGGTTPRRCRATTARVEVCNATYGNNGWLGLASIWVSGSHITKGSAKLNDTYFNTPAYNTPAWRRLVMCQEIAHTFGLDHQDEIFSNENLGTCMDYTSDPLGPPSNEHPNQHDYDWLVTIYNEHLDTTTTASQTSAQGAAPPAMDEIDFAGPGQWGRLIRSTHQGRTELYELDFGGGHKVFTFVIWAEEEERGQERGQEPGRR